ncbi:MULTISPECIES: GNAT family N-acetyltransferase [Micrococcaceae]|jgi:ribosomal protein S18 acetylase RimI-like enzyme|uniref:Acetyltransferase, GNAT family protein n=1 Tax=Paenarthrobacter aurescens (strain TC1) TaxID=290340 RepID=A1R2N3_PAEAT|nr:MULTISPECIES: GNAT family N-acetyltransferase [Micrococcaceae]ABM10232.1 acetyltransferase, GNAT family protein [Paenarthrobacter aurescens TC1]AFR27590.1 putative N-acetyltransferase [Arthrobacter sp. Rue61a]MBP2267524.1 ribosomal protein S18 acetylase RimI-like enzyme [Pseudarthrobacter sp. PvP004]
MTETIRTATTHDAGKLAELAAVTFPLACPPGASRADIQAHLEKTLSEANFTDYLADANITILVLDDGGQLNGYTMLVAKPASDPDVASVLSALPSTELSKCYVHPEHHGKGAASRLISASIADAADKGASGVWLGVNSENAKAIRFYEKSGFQRVGTKSFKLGDSVEHDFVMEHAL